MMTPPEGLSTDTLVDTLRERWGLMVASIEYQAVGFGSHHWVVDDPDDRRWFVTVDDLEAKRESAGDTLDDAFGRLRAALATARDLRDSGMSFVVGPISTLANEPLAPLEQRFAAAVYPYVEGQSFGWGEPRGVGYLSDLLDLIVELHSAPKEAARRARSDDMAVPQRDLVEWVLDQGAVCWDSGPYADLAVSLITAHRDTIGRRLAHYDGLVHNVRLLPVTTVVTHGEPHPGNTMLTPAGLVLIDWDTALIAPPERDLWSLDPGDGSVIDAYGNATGNSLQQSILDLYRLRWDLADMASYVHRFRGPHAGNADDDQSWSELTALVDRLAG